MGNLWDEESVSEYELIAEDAESAEELAAEYASMPVVSEADEEALEEILEDSAFQLDRKEANVIYNARLRLEQAKLYEMLINHNLFDGVDSSPEAINNVQNELKFYIVKRLEILLGIREPVVKTEVISAELPFNDVEIDFLKQLAYKGTLGASATGNSVAPRVEKQVIKSVAPKTTAPQGKLRSLSGSKKQETPQRKTPSQDSQVNRKPPPPQNTRVDKTPVKPQIKKENIKQKKEVRSSGVKIRESGVVPRNLSPQEVEALAREELKNTSKKPFHEMTAREKAERIREANERHKRPTATQAIPMPSSNELEMKYMTQQQSRSMSNNQSDQFNVMLANALSMKKTRGDINDQD